MSHSSDDGLELAKPGERMSKWIGDFAFEKHSDAQWQDAQEATRREPDYFQRHDCLVQSPLLFHQVGKAKDMARAAGRRYAMFKRGSSQPDDRFHRFNIFRTNFNTEIAPRTVPDPMFPLECRKPSSCR